MEVISGIWIGEILSASPEQPMDPLCYFLYPHTSFSFLSQVAVVSSQRPSNDQTIIQCTMASPWNTDTEKTLLLALIDFPDVVPRQRFEEAAAKLGGTFTWNACR